MTNAICLRCGEMKFGAFTPCPNCEFAPKEVEDLARSMLLTDHIYPVKELNRFGRQIKAGKEVEYDPVLLEGYIESMKANPERLDRLQHPEKYPPTLGERIGCFFLPWALFLIIVGLALFAIVRFFQT